MIESILPILCPNNWDGGSIFRFRWLITDSTYNELLHQLTNFYLKYSEAGVNKIQRKGVKKQISLQNVGVYKNFSKIKFGAEC